MRTRALVLSFFCLSSAAMAQENNTDKPNADGATMGQLIADGYEIKAAIPNGKRFVVFLQKDKTGYACEMVNLNRSQCGKIN